MPFAVHSSDRITPSSSRDSQTNCCESSLGKQPATVSSLTSDLSRVDISSNLSASEALTTLASRCVTASRLRTFDNMEGISKGDVCEQTKITDISALRNELEKFRSFGQSLAS